MALSIRHLILALTIVCGGLSLQAQTEAPVAREERQVNIQFSPSCRDSVDGLVFRPAKGKSLEPVVFYSGFRGRALSYKGPEKIEFFEARVAPAATATATPAGATSATAEAPKPVAVCLVPEGMTKALILFVPKAAPTADGLKFDVVAIDDSPEKVAPGSFAVINVTKNDYAIHYGAPAPVLIGQGVSECYRGTGKVMLQLAKRDGDTWDTAGRRGVNLSRGNRVWVILYPPASVYDVAPVIDTLTEELPAVAKPAQTIARFP